MAENSLYYHVGISKVHNIPNNPPKKNTLYIGYKLISILVSEISI